MYEEDLPYGHPRDLQAEKILLAARIFAIVDLRGTLSSKLSPSPTMARGKVLDHVRSLSGVHFDSKVAKPSSRLSCITKSNLRYSFVLPPFQFLV
jgi:hypothetical protein